MQLYSGGKARQKQRPFDFTKYNTRHVALKIAYLGWDYQVSCKLICQNCTSMHNFNLMGNDLLFLC